MKCVKTELEGVLIIEPDVFRDARGFFMESYHRREFSKCGILQEFVQDNLSRSVKGALRGLHYQLAPHSQGKLVRVNEGEVFDVCVDIRINSPTFGRWLGYVLSAQNRHALYIPPGFAHGFCVLSDEAEFFYKCTDYYAPEAERSIAWNDPKIGIKWPIEPNFDLMSKKDKSAPSLEKSELNVYYDASMVSASNAKK